MKRTISVRWLANPNRARNHFPHDFWSSYEYLIYWAKILVLIKWSYLPPAPSMLSIYSLHLLTSFKHAILEFVVAYVTNGHSVAWYTPNVMPLCLQNLVVRVWERMDWRMMTQYWKRRRLKKFMIPTYWWGHAAPSGSLQTHYMVESRATPSSKRGASNKSHRLQTPSQVASETQVGALDRKGAEHLVSWAKMLRLLQSTLYKC